MSGGGDAPAEGGAQKPLLEMRAIRKAYPGVLALKGVDLEVRPGEILALVGENGAGKSTLIKILGGAVRPDSGALRLGGEDGEIRSPQDALRAGVAVIHQEFNLVPAMTVVDNLFLGQERTAMGCLRRSVQRAEARRLFERLGVPVPVDARCRDLSVAQQQIVEIAKALASSARILVLDEPTATLTPPEVERLLQLLRELRSQGLALIYISHRLDEVFAVADRVTVLRDGEVVGEGPIGAWSRRDLIERMVGRAIENEFPKETAERGEVLLEVRDLRRGRAVRGVSFAVRRGEVLGFAGLVGAGRTETARLVFGADRADSGTILLSGRPVRIRSPRDAIRSGICLLTEDRKNQGLVLPMSVQANFALPNSDSLSRWGWISRGHERRRMRHFTDELRIRLARPDRPVGFLSGGNQQKVVLAKWLQRNAEVLLFDEPTRGIDVGAKYEIYRLINRLAAAGKAIVMISSELPEVLAMSDRVLVMHEGRVAAEIQEPGSTTPAEVMRAAVRGSARKEKAE